MVGWICLSLRAVERDVLRSEFHVAFLLSHIPGQQDVTDVAAGSSKGRKEGRKEGMAWHGMCVRQETKQCKTNKLPTSSSHDDDTASSVVVQNKDKKRWEKDM